MRTDWLIIGAGLTGATLAERIASQRREKVLVVDQRNHVGGNAYDEYNEHGLLTHKYGPHIFHTNNCEVFSYLSRFTEWRPYQHKVLGMIEGQLVPIPFNLNSIETLFTQKMAVKFINKLTTAYGFGARVPILQLRETMDDDLKFLADYVYYNIFENYTKKQWGLNPEDLSSLVTARVPILASRDNRYFQDKYQAMPSNGFTALVKNMLSNSNIQILLNTNWHDIKNEINFKYIVFTGSIDEYFDFKYGALPYRSLIFDIQTHHIKNYQQAAVINFPNDFSYTRISEQKKITGQKHSSTTLLFEYPCIHEHGKTIPYYPIPTDKNENHLKLYENEAKQLDGKVIFAGRLGNYKYYNMDQAVSSALSIFSSI